MSRTFPEPAPDLAQIAGLLADESRAAMCTALIDGRAWTVTELATYCAISRPTASEHVSKLVRAALLSEVRQGRHRYVRLAGPEIAEIIESLAALATVTVPSSRSLRVQQRDKALRAGRTCYRHLADELGVSLTDALRDGGAIATDWSVTDKGYDLLHRLGVPTPSATRRPLARGCLDWTERRDHLAGVVGDAVCQTMLERRWLRRIGSGRAVRLTDDGTTALRSVGIVVSGQSEAPALAP